ncbi:MAG: vanadium-dependent haloperoxidase, partial [Chitinophagales bacterium]
REVQAEVEAQESRNDHDGHSSLTKNFSSDVIIDWLNMQLDMLRVPLAAGTGSQAPDRAQSYCGIAAYEAVVPGMRGYESLDGQLIDFPRMPHTENGKAYHWGASANAALAYMNRSLFPTTSATNKTNMDNLENTLQSLYASEVSNATLQRSINFGREVARRVFEWAAADGTAGPFLPYVPTPAFIGPAFWVQSVTPGPPIVLNTTPPNNPQAVNPYASQYRLMVPGVTRGTAIPPPPPYSTNQYSRFYRMAKDVYDKSKNQTADQTAMAIYTRDNPGYPGGGAYVALLSQVIQQATCKLDVAALAYAKVGIGMHEATLILFTKKYIYNLVRPVTYIRNVIDPTWSTLFPTPGHPEFPSGHATTAGAIMTMLTDVFGRRFHFTLDTYPFAGLPPRHYNSFEHYSREIVDARVFAGLHYQATDEKSKWLGEKISLNILRKVEFLKDKEHHGHHNDDH